METEPLSSSASLPRRGKAAEDIPITLRPFHFETDSAAAMRLYESAFPADERRNTALWLRMLRDGDKMRALTVECDGAFAGFVTLWPLEGFTYVEHFAISPTLRGRGIGHEVLEQVLHRAVPPCVVLEVEPSRESAMAKRRIAFYRRSGFHLCRKPYLQPPYTAGGEPVELCLMCNRAGFLHTHFDDVRRTIHHNVYGRGR